jgi:fimbrial isopeptide formation D2 family protein/LPXTG-motif cell wall-anchored protein
MKQTKKLFAMFLAVVMAMVLAVPAFATGETYTITINNSKDGHTYEAYRVFSGDLSENILSNIQWGTGVNGEALLNALKSDGTIGSSFTDCTTAAQVAEVLAGFENNSTQLDAFATLVGNNLSTVAGTSTDAGDTYTISGLAAGYYFVKDSVSVTGQDAQTKFILELVQDTTVTPKSSTPTVDKKVHDEPADAEDGASDGWGETADHAINESFQFKLTAIIPNDANMNAYKSYYINFVDTWSAGVTFEKIDSVMVNETTLQPTQYTVTPADPTSGTSMNVTINDIVPYLGGGKSLAGSTVTVIYSAHLNENAEVTKTNGNTDNKNTVYLEFSNNPNWDGSGEPDKGETPEDTVWVFTYEVDNTKVDGSNGNAPLAGAGFRLYSDESCQNEIQLIFDTAKGAYRPVTSRETGVEMFSAETTGIFNIIGLDAGTYYLKETTIPAGYNEMSPNPFVVTIKATHKEVAEESCNVIFTEDSTMQNQIVNNQGSTLPETGGMGTTIFYIIGGTLVVGAGVLLITKKRMGTEKEQRKQ